VVEGAAMGSVERQYSETLHEQFPTYYANFPPNAPVALGDYGTVRDGVFLKIGSITAFDVPLPAANKSDTNASFEFKSGSAVHVEPRADVSAEGGPAHGAKSKARIVFNDDNGVFFAAAGCTIEGFSEQRNVREAMLNLFVAETWRPEWVLVIGRVLSRALNIVIASKRGASIELSANAETDIDFADARIAAMLKAGASEDIAFQWVAKASTVPLVRLLRVHKSFFGKISHRELIAPERIDELAADLRRLKAAGRSPREAFEVCMLEEDDAIAW
jgi:hypothetical protein